MNDLELIDKYYTKQSTVKMLTSYVLYYQISLGAFAYETTQDQKETISKLKELNLTLDPNIMIISILELIIDNKEDIELEKKLDKYIEIKATFHALNDFVNSDKELLNKENFIEQKREIILQDKFFNPNMKMQYLSEYPSMNKHYKDIITEDYLKSVKDIIIENFFHKEESN